MGFFRKLFGSGNKKQTDDKGLYFFMQCANCGTIVRVRADKQYDLNRGDSGFEWHKTIVDSKCFRRIQTVVRLDSNYAIISHDTSGGDFVTEADWQAQEAARQVSNNTPTTPTDDTAV